MWCSLLLYSAFGYFSVQRLNMHGHIGAVNRRLRTVLDDRGVVLFSSDRERKRIPVLPVTASALRYVLGIESEPAGDEGRMDALDDF